MMKLSLPTTYRTIGLCEWDAARSSRWQIVLALALLSSLVTIPITQHRPLYGLTVGYGGSVALIALYLLHQCVPLLDATTPFRKHPVQLLVTSAVFYGLRLAVYLLVRDGGGWKPRKEMSRTSSRLGRIPFALSLSLLYSCLTCPLAYVVQKPPRSGTLEDWVALAASYGAWIAAISQAIADFHKSWRKHRSANPSKPTFVGPTGGLYGLTRHPNYSAEILYWTSVWLCGTTSYGPRWGPWIASTLGWVTILIIMDGSTRRLEEYQRAAYQDQPEYKEWVQRVPYPLLPGIQSSSVAELVPWLPTNKIK